MTENKPALGFIGLGLLGEAITRRLVGCGYRVTGYDLDPERVEVAASFGVTPATSPGEVTLASDIVLVCVIDTPAVADVVFSSDGVASTGVAGKILIDHSTIDTSRTREMASRLLDACGMAWVDAPVSGGPLAAVNGQLAIMAGGDDDVVATVSSVMQNVAGVFTHMGPVGAGQVTKMVNQTLVLTNYCVIAEALAIAEAGGIDAAKLPDALATGHAGSNLLQELLPRMLARDFTPFGRARQVLKDLDMLHDLTNEMNTPTPMADQAATLFRLLCSRGHQDLDGSAVFKLYDESLI